MPYTYLVPRDTAQIAATYADKCLNLGLLLDRFTPLEAIRNDDILNQRGKAIGKVRTDWLKDQVARLTSQSLYACIGPETTRWLALTAGAKPFEMKLRSRMVVGLGAKGPIEFGITLHPVTGLPYIPGSALKGLCRSYALLTIAGLDSVRTPIEEDALAQLDRELIETTRYENIDSALQYKLVFGSQKEAGGCTFYNAVLYRVLPILFKVDVMTPHFVKYYTSGGNQPPDDADNPNPVTYLTIAEGTTFAFAVGRRRGFRGKSATVEQARSWLKAALQEMGIGAKTAQGYGVFEPVD